MNIQDELKNTILKEIGIESAPQEIQDKILEKLGGNIIKRISLVVLRALPAEAQPEFEKISAGGDEIKLREFLKNTIPNFEELTRKTIRETIDEYKEIAGIK
jgi:hypothetical protein